MTAWWKDGDSVTPFYDGFEGLIEQYQSFSFVNLLFQFFCVI